MLLGPAACAGVNSSLGAMACSDTAHGALAQVTGESADRLRGGVGWYRDGSCRTDDMDRGSHVVCATVDARFLDFTKTRGNDLSTPRPEHRFPGLKPGDRWCLCARRWREAEQAGAAPPVVLEATHARALDMIPAEVLIAHGRRTD
jgi:uncharacterized protein (DUF2237 family)